MIVRYFHILFVLFFTCISFAGDSYGQAKGMSKENVEIPVPPSVHPRLFLRQQHIAQINELIERPDMQSIWYKVTSGAQRGMSINGNHNENTEETIKYNALLYVLKGDKNAGTKAADAIVKYLDGLKYPSSVSRKRETTMGVAAIVYDWCYDLINYDNKQKLIDLLLDMASELEIGYPPVKQSAVTGHAGEYQLQRDLLSVAIAIYDEYPEMYNIVASRFFNEFVPARKFVYESESYHQGTNYGLFRFECDMYPTWIFSRMGAGDIYSEKQGKVPYSWLYVRRPDGQLLHEGDSYKALRTRGEYWAEPLMNLLAGTYYKEPYLMTQFFRESQLSKHPFEAVLFYDPEIGTEPLSGLPLTKYFPEPRGSMVARTGWGEGTFSNAVVAEMKMKCYHFNNHDHLDAGTFQLYYKGQLVSESGIYSGVNGQYGCEHDRNYNKKTIAHNAILVYDPNEQMRGLRGEVVNDGGQRWPNNGMEPKTIDEVLANDMKVADVLAHQFGPDEQVPEFSYIKGNLTNAYSEKVKEHLRSFLFLNLKDNTHPAALIVFDKVVSSDADFKKYWLLHSVQEPEVNGSETTIIRTGNNYNGKMVNHTLLPEVENLEIEKIGGTGKDHWVFGINYDQYPTRSNTMDESANAWRIQASPKEASKQDLFLNVMQVMDNIGNPSPLAVQKIENDSLVGASIGKNIVMFSKSGIKIKHQVTLEVDGEGEMKFILADFEPGKWKIQKEGEESYNICEVSEEGSILYFEGVPGNYQISMEEAYTNVNSFFFDKKKNSEIFFYPNPVENVINIPGVDKKSTLSIIDLYGREVMNFACSRSAFNVRQLEKGIYLLQLKNKNGIKVARFYKN